MKFGIVGVGGRVRIQVLSGCLSVCLFLFSLSLSQFLCVCLSLFLCLFLSFSFSVSFHLSLLTTKSQFRQSLFIYLFTFCNNNKTVKININNPTKTIYSRRSSEPRPGPRFCIHESQQENQYPSPEHLVQGHVTRPRTRLGAKCVLRRIPGEGTILHARGVDVSGWLCMYPRKRHLFRGSGVSRRIGRGSFEVRWVGRVHLFV